MLNFCTLFDSNYLSRGMAMYESLVQHCSAFHLYVFAFDEPCYRYLSKHQPEHLTVIALSDFEDDALLKIKGERTAAEYCWTCTPSTIQYCINHFQLNHCTYLDADMLFYHDPKILIDEMGTHSVLISEHRYTPLYDQSAYSGIYCVQFMCFKNDAPGKRVLQWWRERCLEWCYARNEAGKFGDQKYLDHWTTQFEGVHVMQHEGGGLAPWNIQQYKIVNPSSKMVVQSLTTGKQWPVIFFHFHGLQFLQDSKVWLAGPLYALTSAVKNDIYKPYVQQLLETERKIEASDAGILRHRPKKMAPGRQQLFFQFVKAQLKALSKQPAAIMRIKNFTFTLHNHLHSLNNWL